MEELKDMVLIMLSQEKSNVARFFQVIAAGNTLGMMARSTKKYCKLKMALAPRYHCDPAT